MAVRRESYRSPEERAASVQRGKNVNYALQRAYVTSSTSECYLFNERMLPHLLTVVRPLSRPHPTTTLYAPPLLTRAGAFPCKNHQALVDAPSIFEDLGFTRGENSLLGDRCIDINFFIDDTAEIMGTQVCMRTTSGLSMLVPSADQLYTP